jgi:hypothetical protein
MAVAFALLLAASPVAAGAQAYDAQPYDERPVTHGPFQPEVKDMVREFVLRLASSFGDFYPDAQFRNVRAVYFPSGAIIVCGEMNKVTADGPRSGWRYFSNSGPLIFESEHLETLCDQRTYAQQAFSDDTEYGPDFTHAAVSGLKTQAAEQHP